MIRLGSLTLAALLALGFTSDSANAAPTGLTDRLIDIDLRSAAVENVFTMLGKVGGRPMTLDPCVRGTVDLRLQNMPVSLVLDALAQKLDLSYEDEGDSVRVVCKEDAGTKARLGARVSVTETNSPLPKVLDHVATAAQLEGVDYRASARPNVSMTLNGVRLSTAVTALADATALHIHVSKRRLVVTD
jgi:hypothetical protein